MTAPRFDWPDAIRGLAVLLMMVFHFCFDLSDFGYARFDFYRDPFWLDARVFIVTLFVGVSGVSLALASRNGINWQRFWRREAVLVGCAALISAGTYAFLPQAWIFFGILHFMALGAVLAVPFLRLGTSNLLLGVGLIALGAWVSHPLFDAPALQWLGLMTHKPVTEDYAPLLPWFGVLLVGVFLGRQWLQQAWFAYPLQRYRVFRPLLWLGRHSLLVYMLHQPVFILVLTLFVLASRA
jgi:uncharacterized membrane protein